MLPVNFENLISLIGGENKDKNILSKTLDSYILGKTVLTPEILDTTFQSVSGLGLWLVNEVKGFKKYRGY